MDTTQIPKIQAELAQRTLVEPDGRHKRLYRLIRDEGWLSAGLDSVLSNSGSNTPGIDGETKRKIDARKNGRDRIVGQLREELMTNDYRPQPVKRIYIPKANGKLRPLGIATIRDRVVQATLKMVLEPIYESVFYPFSWGFRPLRSTHHALSALRRGPCDPRTNFKWIIEGDIASCFDEIDHRLLRRFLKKRIQDERILYLITRMLRCGIRDDDGSTIYPQRGTSQGSVVSPVLANVFLHEFDDWYVRTYRVRPEWSHLASFQYRRKKEIGGTLMMTRYADDWVAIWNGSRKRAEEIKAEITAFFADELKLRLSEEKTLITHIDNGFDFLGYRIVGGKRWSDGQWCLFSQVTQKAIRRFRDGVKEISRKTFTDEVAAFTALSGLIRGWGNYYAYAAESRLMDSLDNFIYQQMWKYCRDKNRKMGAKRVFHKYSLPRQLREVGYFQLGLVVGEQIVRVPRLSSIPRKSLRLCYPPHPYLLKGRDYVLPRPGTTDERWWDRHVWAGQEGRRIGQRRLAVEVLARDSTCQTCGEHSSKSVHHNPPWKEKPKHNPKEAMGVCSTCHRQKLHSVVKSNGKPR